ncbi:hypothetical protein CAPTEDRAFT_129920 [Capitella teleta]|uniref:F5/8 type C domain-containing protein n=1 Tax=Capitella teleta TaxID=283909 RepID=R7TNH4_CAPTE|nr:hypothetical protein CAPTEDRAFT_129920 [Capitella teleta]|eukprot:ELT92625.1 hypothetical protein CAPTEDRAFT_129920 [Capitella teleta]
MLGFLLITGDKLGWVPHNSDQNAWLQVDLLVTRQLLAIETLGRGSGDIQYVRTYKVSFSQDSQQWTWYGHNGNTKVFVGNYNNHNSVRNNFDPVIETRFLRLYPLECYAYRTLRWELYACIKCEFVIVTGVWISRVYM